MNYAYFPGCKIPFHLPQYGLATRAVCEALDLGLRDLEFNCCGYPARHNSFEASMFAAARNFALAHAAGLGILTPCKCCFGNLRHAVYWLRESEALRERVAGWLAAEGLHLPPLNELRVVHLLTALDQDLGVARLREAVTRPLTGVTVAAHYGCHALRPGYVTQFDNPLAPTIFERLLQVTGAEPVDWPLRLECCGNPLWGKNDVMAARLARKKLTDARDSGAALLCTACTYCQLQFDTYRARLPEPVKDAPPALLYPQLLGLALGLRPEALGLERNGLPSLLAAGVAG